MHLIEGECATNMDNERTADCQKSMSSTQSSDSELIPGVMRFYRTTKEYMDANPAIVDEHKVIFFDMDNTLYSKSSGVSREMSQRVRLFLISHLHFPHEEADDLAQRFYADYGLAIKGCIEHFQVDPGQYDAFVDGGLHLEELLAGGMDAAGRGAIAGLIGRRWIFTNAGPVHTERVLRLLGVHDLFEGVVYCDYTEPDFPAKPAQGAYERAMRAAGADERDCQFYFIDDSERNVRAAQGECGWKAAWIDEDGDIATSGDLLRITALSDLPKVFPELY